VRETVTVRYLIAGTVVEDTWHGERITYQTHAGGRALVKIHHDGHVAETVAYACAERIHRTIDRGTA
jgi:hypothetical protein